MAPNDICMHRTKPFKKLPLKDFEVLSPKWHIFIRLLVSMYRNLCGRRHRKIIRARGGVHLQGNGAFLDITGLTYI